MNARNPQTQQELLEAERFIARLRTFPAGRKLGAAIERGDIAAVSKIAKFLFFRGFAIAGIPLLLVEALSAYQKQLTDLALIITICACVTAVAVLLAWRKAQALEREAVIHVLAAFVLLLSGLVVVLKYDQPSYLVWSSLFIPIAYYFAGAVRGLVWIFTFACLGVAIMVYGPTLGLAELPDDFFREVVFAYVANTVLLGVFQLTRESYEAASMILAKRLEVVADTDSLTGVYNRRRLQSELIRRVAETGRTGLPLSIVLCDLDQFKAINDKFGHQAGDDILVKFAELLRNGSRTTDIVGRWGGEEFLLILIDTPLEGANNLGEKLRLATRQLKGAIPQPVSCSFGVAQYQNGETWEALLERTDRALYEAKQAGRDAVRANNGVAK